MEDLISDKSCNHGFRQVKGSYSHSLKKAGPLLAFCLQKFLSKALYPDDAHSEVFCSIRPPLRFSNCGRPCKWSSNYRRLDPQTFQAQVLLSENTSFFLSQDQVSNCPSVHRYFHQRPSNLKSSIQRNMLPQVHLRSLLTLGGFIRGPPIIADFLSDFLFIDVSSVSPLKLRDLVLSM